MKIAIGLMAFLSSVALGCAGDPLRDFMPGTYVNSAGGRFSIASDTLTVELVEGNHYIIHRTTGYNIIADEKVGPREYGTEVWQCVYGTATKNLTELRKGKVIAFFPEADEMKVGARVYKKIK